MGRDPLPLSPFPPPTPTPSLTALNQARPVLTQVVTPLGPTPPPSLSGRAGAGRPAGKGCPEEGEWQRIQCASRPGHALAVSDPDRVLTVWPSGWAGRGGAGRARFDRERAKAQGTGDKGNHFLEFYRDLLLTLRCYSSSFYLTVDSISRNFFVAFCDFYIYFRLHLFYML